MTSPISPIAESRLSHQDFMLISLKAAIELENRRLNKIYQPEPIKQLIECLKGSFLNEPDNSPKSFIDYGSITIMTQAIDLNPNIVGSATTMPELIDRASKIVDQLKSAAIPDNNLDISIKLRDFCLALSDCTADYLQTISEMVPSHPCRI